MIVGSILSQVDNPFGVSIRQINVFRLKTTNNNYPLLFGMKSASTSKLYWLRITEKTKTESLLLLQRADRIEGDGLFANPKYSIRIAQRCSRDDYNVMAVCQFTTQ